MSPTVFSAAFVHIGKGKLVHKVQLSFQKHQPLKRSTLQEITLQNMFLSHLSGVNYNCPLKRQ